MQEEGKAREDRSCDKRLSLERGTSLEVPEGVKGNSVTQLNIRAENILTAATLQQIHKLFPNLEELNATFRGTFEEAELLKEMNLQKGHIEHQIPEADGKFRCRNYHLA